MIGCADEHYLVWNLAQSCEIGRQGLGGDKGDVEFSTPEALKNIAAPTGPQR